MANVIVFQIVTLSIDVVGALLGLINTWLPVSQHLVRLKVTPLRVTPVGGMPVNIRFGIQIVVLGAVTVTIDDSGVLYRGTKRRGSIVAPVHPGGGSWPRRLEPRSSVTVYSQHPESDSVSRIKCAYARTKCGRIKKGASPALRQMVSRQGE